MAEAPAGLSGATRWGISMGSTVTGHRCQKKCRERYDHVFHLGNSVVLWVCGSVVLWYWGVDGGACNMFMSPRGGGDAPSPPLHK